MAIRSSRLIYEMKDTDSLLVSFFDQPTRHMNVTKLSGDRTFLA